MLTLKKIHISSCTPERLAHVLKENQQGSRGNYIALLNMIKSSEVKQVLQPLLPNTVHDNEKAVYKILKCCFYVLFSVGCKFDLLSENTLYNYMLS